MLTQGETECCSGVSCGRRPEHQPITITHSVYNWMTEQVRWKLQCTGPPTIQMRYREKRPARFNVWSWPHPHPFCAFSQRKNMYVRVIGNLLNLPGHSGRLMSIVDHNEITHHFLDVIHSHLLATRRPAGQVESPLFTTLFSSCLHPRLLVHKLFSGLSLMSLSPPVQLSFCFLHSCFLPVFQTFFSSVRM